MKSMQLLLYKPQEPAFEVRARDYNPSWMTAATILDDDTYLGAENSFNLFVVRKNSEAATDEERSRLDVIGQFHLGEFVNRFRHGSLVMRLPDSELSTIPTLLFGTINGVIGVIASLPQDMFDFLRNLQVAMRKVVKGVGGFSHAEWRSFAASHNSAGDPGFVDGDLIEQFLDLKRESMEAVVAAMDGVTVDKVVRLVEELARLH
jgi:DNA damage-binding protein 1